MGGAFRARSGGLSPVQFSDGGSMGETSSR